MEIGFVLHLPFTKAAWQGGLFSSRQFGLIVADGADRMVLYWRHGIYCTDPSGGRIGFGGGVSSVCENNS